MPIVTALTLFTLLFVITHRVKAQSIVSTPNSWSYKDPSLWGRLQSDFSACGDGRSQSPIDLSSGLLPDKPLLSPSLRFHYDDLHATLTAVNASHHTTLNNGHSIMVKYDDAASHTTYRDKRYQLLQFHFHAPSEHTVDDKHADMELHLVHADANNRLLVVGFMIQADEGEEEEEEERRKRGVTASHSALDFLNALLWSHLPTTPAAQTQSTPPSASSAPASSSPLLYHLDSVLSSTPTSSPLFYHYPGSLTTPPCTEGVQWFVHSALLHISRSQLSAYTRLFPDTSRPVQPLNGRAVVVLGGAALEDGASGPGTLSVLLFFGVVAVALLLVWWWHHTHSAHTLGEMMDASMQQNVDKDKQADVQWRRDRDVKSSSTTSAMHDDDVRPLLSSTAGTASTVLAQADGKVMRRASGSRSASNEHLYGLYKNAEENKKAGTADEPRSSPKAGQLLVRR